MADTDSLSDLEILARTIYGEARGEEELGKEAVASVIVNRANHGGWWGDTIREVCLKPEQFSCWNESDPNRAVILTVDEDNSVYQDCLAIATSAFDGTLDDPTDGCDSYSVCGLVTEWNKKLVPYAIIGRQAFYRTV